MRLCFSEFAACPDRGNVRERTTTGRAQVLSEEQSLSSQSSAALQFLSGILCSVSGKSSPPYELDMRCALYVRDPLSLLAPIFLVTMMVITLESAADARHWRATYARIELAAPPRPSRTWWLVRSILDSPIQPPPCLRSGRARSRPTGSPQSPDCSPHLTFPPCTNPVARV